MDADESVEAATAVARTSWLRAAVLGADDGIVSIASLLVGMAASAASPGTVLVAGIAGLVAGATSMAAGEYVSVSSQRDLEEAELGRAREKLARYPEVARTEVGITLQLRGVDPGLAQRAAAQVLEKNPLEDYARIRLGISDATRARPAQAALASAAAFTAGGAVPLAGMLLAPGALRLRVVVALAIVALTACGALGADVGGASRRRAALRVVVGGGLAMAISAAVGRLVGVAV